MKVRGALVLSLLILSLGLQAQNWQSDLVKINTSTGELTYNQEPTTGTRIPDFSRAGYKGGGVALPEVEVKKTISAISGDNTAHIQAAINEVSALVPDENGIRGALLLNPGSYEVRGELEIKASGVTLRGSGDGENASENTILNATGNSPSRRTVLTIGGGSRTNFQDEVSGTRTNIVTPLVKVGDKSFEVADASSLKVGDNIIIYHPCTLEWLTAIDFGGTEDQSERWRVDEHPLVYNTRIERIECNKIFTNSPVFNDLDRSLAQSYIYKYRRDGLLENIGVEDLRIDIAYNAPDISDNEHARSAVDIVQAENSWVDNCTFLHFSYAGVDTYTANYITVSNSEALEPISPITGGFRYNFTASKASQNILFTNCKANNGRHAYVSNGTSYVAGIVFHDCESEDPFTSSEGHRRWSTGLLYDRFRDKGRLSNDGRVLAFYNRGDFGTGHGWSSVNSVAWNCDTRRSGTDGQILIERPPQGQNFAVGCRGIVNGDGPFNKSAGYIEGTNRSDNLIPSSLYAAQLADRKELEEVTEIDVIFSCEPYTWVDGNTYTSSNNSATVQVELSPTCTITKELNLTIPQISTDITTTETSLIAVEEGATYLWERCDESPITGNTNRELILLDDGGYRLTVNKNGCSVTSRCYTGIVGTKDVELKNAVTIFPNPSDNGIFTLSIETEWEVLNLQGETILEGIGNRIDLTNQNNGVYIIKTEGRAAQLVTK